MDRSSRVLGLVVGVGAAFVAALPLGNVDQARAARSRSKLRVVSVNVDGLSDVVLNQIIEIRFNARISPASLKDGSIAVVPVDLTNETTGDARPVTLSRRGNTVQLIPTLPTHAVDPNDPEGDFYAPGSPGDDAFENGSFRPGTDYRLVIAGRSETRAVKSTSRAKLSSTATFDFRTREETSSEPLFEQEDYLSPPPPRVLFTNPGDGLMTVDQRFARTSGIPAVPIRADITLFCNDVAFDPITLREPGAVQLLRLRADETPTAVAGDVVVEQDRNRANLTFRPALPLEEGVTYALRIAESVKELSGTFALVGHVERQRLNDAYAFLDAVRRNSPSTPVEQLPDPPADLIYDWPFDQFERGALKARLLKVGDRLPSTIDPRVFTVFTTRREPVVRTQESAAAAVGARGAALAEVDRLVTPLGLQGREGVGRDGSVVLPFTLIDRRSRKGAVELEYGVDLDRNGIVDDGEYRPLTIERVDARNTGIHPRPGGSRGLPFVTAPDSGRSNAVVWKSSVDLDRSAFRTLQLVYTPQGREIDDPNDPGHPLFREAGTGVIVRMRSVRGRRKASPWIYSDQFELSNSVAPDLTIDDVTVGTVTSIAWSAIDDDSEDFNGNGILDPLTGEDVNGNGVLDTAFVAVAFDFVVLGPTGDVNDLTDEELAALDWVACTRDGGAGDPDVDLVAAPTGLPYAFAWDHVTDGLGAGERVILRGRTFDQTQLVGRWVYMTEPATIGE